MQHPVDVRFAKPASQLTEQEIHAMTKDELQRLLYTSGPYHPVSHRIPAYADRGDLIRMALTPAYGVHAYAARAGDPVFRWGKLRRENIVARHAQAIPNASKTIALFLGCLLTSMALLSFQEGLGALALPELPTQVWWYLAAYAIGWLALATATWQWSVTRMEAGRSGVISIAELIVALLSAALIGGEVMDAWELAGAGLIAVAAVLAALEPAAKAGPASA